MALNDRDITLGGNLGVDAYPGVANPTISSTSQNPLAANYVRCLMPLLLRLVRLRHWFIRTGNRPHDRRSRCWRWR